MNNLSYDELERWLYITNDPLYDRINQINSIVEVALRKEYGSVLEHVKHDNHRLGYNEGYDFGYNQGYDDCLDILT